MEPQPEEQTQPQDQKQTSGSPGSATTHRCITKPLTESHPPPERPARLPQGTSKKSQPSSQSRGLKTQSQISTQTGSHGSLQHPEKRKRDLEVGSPAKRRSSCGQDPVKAPSTKPWPVFTIAKPPPEGDR